MKTIGIIGGTSWESTVTYYQIINEKVKEELGGLSSAKILLYSVNFAEVEGHMSRNEWDDVTEILTDAAMRLERAGADFILLGSNTTHKCADGIAKNISVPIIHIADAVAEAMKANNVHTAALLGTRFTMQEDFIKGKLEEAGFRILVPNDADQIIVDEIIFKELCLGILKEGSRAEYKRIIAELKENGADAVILGCTEIGLLIKEEDSVLPIYDTAILHPLAAVKAALDDR